jgi:hypothetical protein
MKIPKIHRFFYVLFFTVIIGIGLIYTACDKKKKPFETPRTESGSGKSGQSYSYDKSSGDSDELEDYDEDNDTLYVFERSKVSDKIKPIDERPMKLPFSTNAHKKYLSDPLAFVNLPDGGVPSGPTAVVGSDECFFYPIASVSSMDDLKKLTNGEKIPFAAIIPLGEKWTCYDSEYGDLFDFQDNLNYFIKTTWNGKQGIVFGADLYGDRHGIKSSNEENRVNSLLYKDNGYFSAFYPVTGYDDIRADIQNELKANGISFQEVKKSEYDLRFAYPDDMISLYMNINKKGPYGEEGNQVIPIFVTTDLAAHSNHLVFDRLLQYCEEEYFFPQLTALVNEYIKTIEQKKEQIPSNVYDRSILYFQTAQALLALAPKRVEDEDGYRKTIVYKKINAEQVLSKYPEQVGKEIELMNNAAGFSKSAVFPDINTQEDYSQYKVRGHYTKNGVLGAYFRALIWFGRINFNLGGETDSAKNAAEKLAPTALFITDITENSPQIKKLWQSLFDPITELIGVSDDISFYELAPLWNKVKGANFLQWYNNPDKLKNFINKEYKDLRTPSISGSSLFSGVYDGGEAAKDRLPPVGWRLFGQRYTLDSEIHHYASPPRFLIPKASANNQRHIVKGLDIMKVFGSKTADRLLKESDYPKYAGLERVMNSLQQNMTSIKDDYWFSTYYTNILYQIKTQALFENGTGFYFTEKPNWNLKAMNSAHGTWAELRHDTILYVKQDYSEYAGGGYFPSYRIKPLPKPIHYIEPNVPFWNTSAVGIQKLYRILEKYDFLDGKSAYALAGMHNIFVKAAEISKLEADDKEVSAKDLEWIATIPAQLAKLVVALLPGGGYIDNNDSLRMALVADVFTASDPELVLEAAVGIPYRLYIPLNDKQGGKRIAIGYGFSYYEFTQPMSNRLNNEQWKAVVYTNNFDMNKYLPFWMQGKFSKAK